MIWNVNGTDVVVSDEFARACSVFEMFRDETDTWLVPLPIHREIAFLNDLAITRSTGGTVALHVAKHETSTLLAALDAADYLDCDLKTDIATELARRLEGKSPHDMAEILGIQYTENAKLEYALRNYLIPSDAVPPWPSSD
jgi:hypothetical protein